MLSHHHPADELAELRLQIKGLKARELELRKALLHGNGGLQGKMHRAVLSRKTRRVFLKDRLPAALLQDDSLWEERLVTYVKTERWPALRAIQTSGSNGKADHQVDDWGSARFDVIDREDRVSA